MAHASYKYLSNLVPTKVVRSLQIPCKAAAQRALHITETQYLTNRSCFNNIAGPFRFENIKDTMALDSY